MTADRPAPPPLTQFDVATTVRSTGEGVAEASIDRSWCLGEIPNGGYVLALMLRAARVLVPSGDLMSLSGHFLAAPHPGPVDLEIAPVRIGRTAVRLQVRMLQGGDEKVRVLAVLGGEGSSSRTDVGPARHDLPRIEECRERRVTSPDGREAPVRQHLEMRYAPGSLGWLDGRPTGRPVVEAWIRSGEGRATDDLLLPLAVDVLPATVYELGLTGWTPTVELTLHQVAPPRTDWVFCRTEARFVGGHAFIEDATVWDATGRLVAMSRQQGLLPR